MRYPITIFLTALTFLTEISNADEYTVEAKPFKVETTLNAVFLPAQFESISVKPKVWMDFTITDLAAQGAVVKKGDTLIGIDATQLDQQIDLAEKARVSDEMNLAQLKHDLAQLEITTPRSLANYARSEKEAAENLKWYTEIGQAKEIEETKRGLKDAELRLSYQKEELKQLLKMYAEDDKTEETEEIILTRTRNAVERAEFTVKMAGIDVTHALDTNIPRKLKSHQLSAESARITNTSAKENLPRALERKSNALALALHNDKLAVEKLAKLRADRTMMSITAPADGIIYYGSMENGRWHPASAAKVLKVGGKLPGGTTIMTFIPAKAELTLSAFTAENTLTALTANSSGYATTHLNRYQSFPVTITSIASHPEIDGSFRVTLKPKLPDTLMPVPGMKANVRIVTGKTDNALTIPTSFLSRTEDGLYSVKIKLADGKSTERKVTLGASNKEVVIVEGLDIGQVIVK